MGLPHQCTPALWFTYVHSTSVGCAIGYYDSLAQSTLPIKVHLHIDRSSMRFASIDKFRMLMCTNTVCMFYNFGQWHWYSSFQLLSNALFRILHKLIALRVIETFMVFRDFELQVAHATQ